MTPTADRRGRAIAAIAALALIATYVTTWPLWHGRTAPGDPPTLPVVPALEHLPFGTVLVLAAAAAALTPRLGAVAHTALLVLAVAADQVRLQPEVVSLAILVLAGAWPTTTVPVIRWHLVALWGWAGLHKLLSAGWPDDGAVFIADAVHRPGWHAMVAVVVPLAEISLAVLALSRRWWPALRIAAPLFHLGIVATLVLAFWNRSVWPWNLALAAAVPLLFVGGTAGTRPRLVPVAATALALYPAAFYIGLADAYPAHNLYSGNTARASICTAADARACRPPPFDSTWDRLRVPLPPERRLFAHWFQQICRPGQWLRVDGIHTRLFERQTDFEPCDARLSSRRPARSVRLRRLLPRASPGHSEKWALPTTSPP